ncbi:sigma-70 family RNA polymerase sigma factor [Flavonifractor sp. DFI.6.63]|uniref:RNA polymerase sigma factor n=1 Tax=Flavonifractor sp. DFI.6.63 TaxID=2963704 RepID=UPI0021097AF1|nr:sigma-70 family RNA polymerase sigma factor [Flavonifractor sp. DFI.6.63]MCQ5028625.1 sigma-70 family RNA polymerase sigma factor [Flavonifractor sp. DFI.6.63]
MYDGLEALYRRHVGEVYLYAYSLCKNPDQAQDLVGETFYRALLSLEREGEWKGWLFRVCRNLWVDSMRRRKFQTGEPPDPERLAAEEDLLEDLIREERRRAVYRAVLELSPADREAVTLHYCAGLPLREVGAAMGLSPGAARTLLCRARQKLKTRLEGQL